MFSGVAFLYIPDNYKEEADKTVCTQASYLYYSPLTSAPAQRHQTPWAAQMPPQRVNTERGDIEHAGDAAENHEGHNASNSKQQQRRHIHAKPEKTVKRLIRQERCQPTALRNLRQIAHHTTRQITDERKQEHIERHIACTITPRQQTTATETAKTVGMVTGKTVGSKRLHIIATTLADDRLGTQGKRHTSRADVGVNGKRHGIGSGVKRRRETALPNKPFAPQQHITTVNTNGTTVQGCAGITDKALQTPESRTTHAGNVFSEVEIRITHHHIHIIALGKGKHLR